MGDRQQQKQEHLQVQVSTSFCVRAHVQLVIANYILQHNPYQELLPSL